MVCTINFPLTVPAYGTAEVCATYLLPTCYHSCEPAEVMCPLIVKSIGLIRFLFWRVSDLFGRTVPEVGQRLTHRFPIGKLCLGQGI